MEDKLTSAQWYYYSSNNPFITPFLIKKILFSVIRMRYFNYDLETSCY